jgi:adenylate cyclase
MERAQLKRRLSAVLIADVVGYSRLMNVDEEGTHRRLTEYVKDVIEPRIADDDGRLIRSAGDGFLVEFDSAIAAVRCGLDIQRELTARDARAPPGRRMQLRIGINTGDVIVESRDIYGNRSISRRDWRASRNPAGYTSRGVSATSCTVTLASCSTTKENGA